MQEEAFSGSDKDCVQTLLEIDKEQDCDNSAFTIKPQTINLACHQIDVVEDAPFCTEWNPPSRSCDFLKPASEL